MKLYTEDSFHQKLFNYFSNEHNLILLESEMDEIIRIVKSNYIELPSDEEIKNEKNLIEPYATNDYYDGFSDGINWMKEQILNQNK